MATCAAFFALSSSQVLASEEPQVFAPGVISGQLSDASPAFAPDGKTLFFMRGTEGQWTILESHRKNARWSEPQTAPFSGKWRDLDPVMAPDGSFLLFVSNRPATAQGSPIDASSRGKDYPGMGMNIWRVNRHGNSWDAPIRLPDVINTSSSTFAPSAARDGSVYFIGRDSTGRDDLYLLRSQYQDGNYLPATVVAIGDESTQIRDPEIAPDESFIVFSTKSAASNQPYRLAIAFRKDGHWGTSVDLGDGVNGPSYNMGSRLGADHRTLYFYNNRRVEHLNSPGENAWNNGSDNIWYLSLAPWIDARRSTPQ